MLVAVRIFLFPFDQLRRKHPAKTRELKNLARIAEKMYLTFKTKHRTVSKSARAQSTESREVHTQRTIAEEEDRFPKSARYNPEVPR